MIPGTTTKLSELDNVACATVLDVKSDLVIVTSTTTTTVIETINPHFGGGFSGIFLLVNTSGGNITTVTTGNIIVARTIPASMPVVFVFSKSDAKWYVGAIS